MYLCMRMLVGKRAARRAVLAGTLVVPEDTMGKSYEDDEIAGGYSADSQSGARKQLNSCTLLNKELTTS